MQIALFGRNAHTLKNLLKDLKLSIVEKNPDVIISYGGDGTLLASERFFPGIPKLPIRDSLVCKKCSEHSSEALVKGLLENKLVLTRHQKLETLVCGKTFLSLNDVILRNSNPIHAIRFNVYINGKQVDLYADRPRFNRGRQDHSPAIGDGLVAATPFGSSGYFKSITQTTFDKGFGLAFNNLVTPVAPVYFGQGDKIEVKLTRGPAILAFDNNPDHVFLDETSTFTTRPSAEKALIYEPQALRCKNCELDY